MRVPLREIDRHAADTSDDVELAVAIAGALRRAAPPASGIDVIVAAAASRTR